jgi:cell division septation protein DedD
MADKNLHDIKIDELGSSKKTPLKNILTLLGLLLIILAISIVITRLILNTDEGSDLDNNDSKSALVNGVLESNRTADHANAILDTANETKDTAKNAALNTAQAAIANSNIIERNLTSAIKVPLTSHEPKVMRTYKEPKKSSTPKVAHHNETKKTVTKHTTVKHTTTHTHPKKEYIDKVVAKKHTTSTPSSKHTKSSSSKHASYLGGHKKDVTNSYYIKVGTYRDASTVLRKIKKNHFNYALVKVENDKSLTRVLVGPFFSRNQANGQLAKVKANILIGAYVTKVQ